MKNVSKNGFTLLEICVAIAIVAVGIMTSMSMLAKSLEWAGNSKRDLAVTEAVQSAVAGLRAGEPVSYLSALGLYQYPSTGNLSSSRSPYVVMFGLGATTGLDTSGASYKLKDDTTYTGVSAYVYTRDVNPGNWTFGTSYVDQVFKTFVIVSKAD